MIDKCPHTFADLATRILPGRMRELLKAMRSPMPLRRFAEFGVGPATILHGMGRDKDFSACYVLIDADKRPSYVGISGKVIGRVLEHLKGTDHYTASLAHTIAARSCGYKGTRGQAAKDPAYAKAFKLAKSKLAEGSVAFVEIENPLELYVFEAYAAMDLDTTEWNSFATH